jgi:ABC-type transport system substrate-binding protein
MAEFAWFGFNCRDYQPAEGANPGQTLQPCNDSKFRTAMNYVLGTETKASITAAIIGPLAYALDSIIPPAQAYWNDPTCTMAQDQDYAKQMLLDAGYTVVSGVLYNPDGTPVRTLALIYSSASAILKQTIEAYCKVWNQFFYDVMGVTAAGGGGYLNYPIKPTPMAFGSIIMQILYTHDYDMCTLGWTNLGRFADWTYDLFHSKFTGPGDYNMGGFVNDTCDELVETIKFNLNVATVRAAAFEFQQHFLYEWNPYIVRSGGYQAGVYGRRNPSTGVITRLTNWLPMPSYCSDNDWTWSLMHWEVTPPAGQNYVNRRIAEPPSELHPWYADELYEWNILDRTIAGLLNIVPTGPDSLADMPWIACNWSITYWHWPALGIENGMKVTFNLRHDVYWQNGDPLTAEDVMMNWDMLREWKPGRYSSMWENLIYTEIESPYTVSAYINKTSLYSLYDFAGTGLFFPKRILQEYEARLHDIADPMYHNPRLFTPSTQDYTAFFTHTTIPVDPAKVDPLISPKYEGLNIASNIGHNPSGAFAEPANMIEQYKCLIGCNPYIFDYWHSLENIAHSVKFPEFWWNCPIKENFIAPTRVDPGQSFTYYDEVQNLGAKAGGKLVNVTIAYINITVDHHTIFQIPGPIVIHPWETLVFGASGYVTYEDFQKGIKPTPYTYTFPVQGLHYLDSVVVIEDPIVLTDSSYNHYIWVTIKEDITLDIKVDMIDMWLVAKSYGANPGHPRWNSAADIDDNFKVDMLDMWNIARMFGWPK